MILAWASPFNGQGHVMRLSQGHIWAKFKNSEQKS